MGYPRIAPVPLGICRHDIPVVAMAVDSSADSSWPCDGNLAEICRLLADRYLEKIVGHDSDLFALFMSSC